MLSTIKSLLQATQHTIVQRIKSPTIITFIISWVICNWQPLLYFMFLEGNIDTKIQKALEFKNIYDQLIYPIIISIIYIICLPYINLALSKLLNKHRIYFLRKFEDNCFVLHEQERKVIARKIELEQLEGDLKNKKNTNNEIDRLEKLLKQKDKEISNINIQRETDRNNFEITLHAERRNMQNHISSIENELKTSQQLNKELNKQINFFTNKEIENIEITEKSNKELRNFNIRIKQLESEKKSLEEVIIHLQEEIKTQRLMQEGIKTQRLIANELKNNIDRKIRKLEIDK